MLDFGNNLPDTPWETWSNGIRTSGSPFWNAILGWIDNPHFYSATEWLAFRDWPELEGFDDA